MSVPVAWLLFVPVATYFFSYLYLAFYHQRLWLLNTVIHEGGIYTLLQTIFYASHFLGHVPSLTVIAILFAGSLLCLQPALPQPRIQTRVLVSAIAILLALSAVISWRYFGAEDTIAYVTQHRQGVGNDVLGGSWNLHLPSTITLIVGLPLYIVLLFRMMDLPAAPSFSRKGYVGLAGILILLFTALSNRGSLAPLGWIWLDPRYLAHSVRELATFSLIFFPLPLYFALECANLASSCDKPIWNRSAKIIIASIAVVCVVMVAYQTAVPLQSGIGSLAQRPAFTKGPSLGLPYLLAAHFFEHVLDSIYFTLLTLLLLKWNRSESTLRPA